MSSVINVNAMLVLAGSVAADDLSEYDQLPEDIRNALKEEIVNDRKAAASTAAKGIVALLKSADAQVANEVAHIRSMRQQVTKAKANLEELTNAKAFGLATNNFLPLMKLTGVLATYQVTQIINEQGPSVFEVDLTKIPAKVVTPGEQE